MSDNDNKDFFGYSAGKTLDDIIAEHSAGITEINTDSEAVPDMKPAEQETANIEYVVPSTFDDALKNMQEFFRVRENAVDDLLDDYPALRLDLNVDSEKEAEPEQPAALSDEESNIVPEAEAEPETIQPEQTFRPEEDEAEEEPEEEPEKEAEEQEITASFEEAKQTEILLFDDFRRRREETTQNGDEDEYGSGARISESKRGLFRKLIKKNGEDGEYPEQHGDETREEELSEPEYIEEEEIYEPEPDFGEAVAGLLGKVRGMIVRSRITLIIALVMFVLTLMAERGSSLPFLVDRRVYLLVITAMQLVCVFVSYDVIARGFTDIFRKSAGAHTLVLFSTLAAIIVNVLMIANVVEMAVSFSTVAALSAGFALFGDSRKLTAQLMALRTATDVSAPHSVTTRYVREADARMILRHKGGTAGFYNDIIKRDFAEKTYAIFCPFLIVASILLSLAVHFSGKASFALAISSLASASAAFSALSAYALPFLKTVRKLRKSGATVSGWGGADDIYSAHGVRITDDDLFPTGTVVESAKAYEGFKLEKVIRYTASIMIAADNGLSKPFSELLASQSISTVMVEDIKPCQDGIMAVIRGERVLCGTSACMTLYGIKTPQSLNSKNTIYVAVNGQPAGVLTIAYKPSEAVQSSLLSMIKSRFTLFFAVRDFNVSPLMVKQRLQIPIDDIECFTVDEVYKISSMQAAETPHTAAVIARFSPKLYAETLSSALSLRSVTVINTVVSVITTIVGILLAFFMCLKGEGGAVSPTSLAEFMFAMQVITMIISRAA